MQAIVDGGESWEENENGEKGQWIVGSINNTSRGKRKCDQSTMRLEITRREEEGSR